MFFSTVETCYKFLPPLSKRPFRVTTDSASFMSQNVAVKDIKCRPQVMGDISDKESNISGRIAQPTNEPRNPRLRVILDTQSVEMILEDADDVSIKILDVMIGPFDF